jgi:hypothetical protein
MTDQNCWEFKKCGREPNGTMVAELGVCPASIETKVDGIHGGKNGGRSCWVVSGTYCGGKVQGTYASKLSNCLTCEFFINVGKDIGKNRVSTGEILELLK